MKVTLPNGDRMGVVEFLTWWRSVRGRRSPAPGGAAGGCVAADLFNECFDGATVGSITGAAPGPLNGWLFTEPFGPKGGTVSFVPGTMTFNCVNGTTPGAEKAHTAIASISNLTFRFEFTEFPGPPIPNRRYEFFVTNTGATEMLQVTLNEDGNVFIDLGSSVSLDDWSGAWTPTSGAHKIHVTVDALNVPRLWLDDVEITLTFNGTGFSPGGVPSANTCAAFYRYATVDEQATMTNMYLASGNLSFDTVFCCP